MASHSAPAHRSPAATAILRLLRQSWSDLLRTEQLIATSNTVPNDTARREASDQVLAARNLLEGVGQLLRRELR